MGSQSAGTLPFGENRNPNVGLWRLVSQRLSVDGNSQYGSLIEENLSDPRIDSRGSTRRKNGLRSQLYRPPPILSWHFFARPAFDQSAPFKQDVRQSKWIRTRQ